MHLRASGVAADSLQECTYAGTHLHGAPRVIPLRRSFVKFWTTDEVCVQQKLGPKCHLQIESLHFPSWKPCTVKVEAQLVYQLVKWRTLKKNWGKFPVSEEVIHL